jgi:ATP-dependent Clp protease ATP-binding subunit ClpC
VFERFTDRARRVVVLAQEEAQLLGHGYIGTEHILLGLLAETEGLGAQALRAVGADLEQMRQSIEDVIGRGSGEPPSHMPFTPRAKKVLELSLREAIGLGHKHIGTEHIILGLLTEGEGVANHVLAAHGITDDAVRHEVANLVGVNPAKTKEEGSRPAPRRLAFPSSCKHPDDALQTRTVEGMRTIRCTSCGTLIGVLPAS